jgi:asparagine synthase (glutamine-hydrolysing)
MCGITGIVSTEAFNLQILEQMTSAIQHRGPDDEGFVFFSESHADPVICGGKHTPRDVLQADLAYTPQALFDEDLGAKAKIALAHRRLSIVDLSACGHQPMCSPDQRFWIVFNGEVYNYLELRAELEKLGYEFVSHSDTEVVLTAYQHWGAKCLTRFIGMWALAIYDQQQEELFLARDPFGIKPLFYSILPGKVAFSSEISPLLEFQLSNKNLNSQKGFEYIQFGATDNGYQTMIEGISQIPPANYMTLDVNTLAIKPITRYWKPELKRNLDIGFNEAAKQLKTLFLKSVDLHLRSDVPVGAALSGGIDSSAIVCAIRHLDPQVELHTFTYVAEEATISEEKWANLVAQHVGAIMHKVSASPEELVADLDKLIRIQGEPFGSTSIYAQHKVFQKVHEVGIKVVLDGQGADEIFGGYSGYFGARLASLIRQFQWIKAVTFFVHASNLPGINKNHLFSQVLKFFIPTALIPVARKVAMKKHIQMGFNDLWLQSNKIERQQRINQQPNSCNLKEALAKTLTTTSIPALLRYEDRNSMAYSVESRVPFLNSELVDFVYSLPEHYLIDNHATSKAIFRQAMRGLVPDEILDRKDKIGFETPEKKWLATFNNWVVEGLEKANHSKSLDAHFIIGEWHNVLDGKKAFNWQIWRWLNYLRWLELHQVNETGVAEL